MAVTSGFFNSINGDRKYNARQIGMYLGKIIRSGVFSNPSTNLPIYLYLSFLSCKHHTLFSTLPTHWVIIIY